MCFSEWALFQLTMRNETLKSLYRCSSTLCRVRPLSTKSYRELVLFDDPPIAVDRSNTPFRFPRLMTALTMANIRALSTKTKIELNELHDGVRMAYRTVSKSISENKCDTLTSMVDSNLLTRITIRVSELAEGERRGLFLAEPYYSTSICAYMAERDSSAGSFLDIFSIFVDKEFEKTSDQPILRSQIIGNVILTRKFIPETEDEEGWTVDSLNYKVLQKS